MAFAGLNFVFAFCPKQAKTDKNEDKNDDEEDNEAPKENSNPVIPSALDQKSKSRLTRFLIFRAQLESCATLYPRNNRKF